MKICSLINIALRFLTISLIECSILTFNLHQVINISSNYHQVTSYLSDDFTKIPDLKTLLFHEFPNAMYSFGSDHKVLHNKSFKNEIKNMYTLQESLVLFYTNDLNQTNLFIDFLKSQLSVRQRPKCLIVYSNSFKLKHELDVMSTLKNAWKKKFLDFTILINLSEKTITHSLMIIYYFNPFDDIVYEEKFDQRTKIFPDKLKNTYEYPLNVQKILGAEQILLSRKSNCKDYKFHLHLFQLFKLTAKSLNLKLVYKNVIFSKDKDFFEKNNLDLIPSMQVNFKYRTNFLIPSDEESLEIVAYVPIIQSSRTDIYLKILHSLLIVTAVIFNFFYILGYFQKTSLGKITMFDNVRLLLGQSIANEPKKSSLRIIMLTVIVASTLIMNDILSDIISIQFEKREIPFETYKDLYDSRLQTYAFNFFCEYYMNNSNDPYLQKIYDRTLVTDNLTTCYNDLIVWKNTSCITFSFNPELVISRSRNSDGLPTVKVAQPHLLKLTGFHKFPAGSPYALKFLAIMRRIKETSLIHWPLLVYKNVKKIDVDDSQVTFDDGVNFELLMTILSFGFFISIVVFFMEFLTFKIFSKKTLLCRGSFCRYLFNH